MSYLNRTATHSETFGSKLYDGVHYPLVINAHKGPVSELVSKFMVDGSTKDMSDNYSDAGLGMTEFKIAPAPGEVYFMHRIIVSMADNQINSGGYGGLSSLTNGILIQKKNASGIIVDYTDGVPIRRTADWSRYCYDTKSDSYGTGDVLFSARWTFINDGGPIRLSGDDGEYLCAVINDDLSGLEEHYIMTKGHYE